MDPTIAMILKEFSLDEYRPIIPRELDLGEPLPPRAGNLVKAITGMRRSGKTYRLFQEMDRIHRSGVPWSRIWYFNFEDNRLAPITPRTGDDVLEAIRYLGGADPQDGLYLFFDELQEMENWGAWLRRVVDTTKATIYASGSSSKMLSKEIATEFRGRALDFELLPYSFRELLASDPDGTALMEEKAWTASERARIQKRFDSYLERGGFPAVQGLPASQASALLQSYTQRVVARDVVERHNLAKPRLAAALARKLMGLNARQLSIRKVENDLRSAGLASGRGYLADLVAHFEDAFLLFRVKEFSLSLSENTTAQPKVYAIDPGLALANSKAGACDRGQRLEGAVYLELRRRCPSLRDGAISLFRTKEHGYEIDFALGDVLDGEASQLIQVTEAMDDPKTSARETRALWEALSESGLDEGVIIVGNGDETEYEQGGKRIHQIPAWKWFIDPNRP